MRPEERDAACLWDMLEACRQIAEFVRGVDFGRYQSDKLLESAVERQLEIVGEAARQVSSGFQAAHPEVPWRLIIGQRNVLAHQYGSIQPDRVYRVAMERVPDLIRCLAPLIPPERK
ncbi:MAG: DUF86 domain-containing protein [Kiritimatiellae bacterium]|nr:DUF86 domain-containing protein [Kiritimatiellia bacterium]